MLQPITNWVRVYVANNHQSEGLANNSLSVNVRSTLAVEPALAVPILAIKVLALNVCPHC